jgi:hypothetical protein
MPTIYHDGSDVAELKGSVRGGLVITLHDPAELQRLQDLVAAVDALPGDPLANTYRVVAKAGPSLANWITPVTRASRGDRGGDVPHPNETPVHDAKARSLFAALALARVAWSNQGADAANLACAVMLARPGRKLRFKSRRPSLTLDYGSIRARALAAGATVRAFGVSLFPVARSRRQIDLVRTLRSSAKGEPLPTIESLRPEHLEGKQGVVIFLHGLLSTDVGTFDGLVTRLRESDDSLCLTSWPHDTLDPIELNAEMLAEHMQRRLGRSGLPLLFVCHSRGGLVGRRTIVELLRTSHVWKSRLRGLVTFGTPHEGAELAEKADQLLGKLLLLHAVRKAGALPLVRGLQTVAQFKKLPGITDLRPRKNGGAFLRRLMKAEKDLTGEFGTMPVPLMAVGGTWVADSVTGWLTNRFFEEAPHDLVVALESTAPEHLAERVEVASDHFSYFDGSANEANAGDWRRVLDFVSSAFGEDWTADAASPEPVAAIAGPSEKKTVRLNRTVSFRDS